MIDAVLLLFTLGGVAFAYGLGNSGPGLDRTIGLVVSVGFAGFGVWGLWHNGSARITFDTRSQIAVIEWRVLKGIERREFRLGELSDVWVHEDDHMHTLKFTLTNGPPILFERAYGTNRKAYDVAKEVRAWLQDQDWKVGAT